MRLPTCPGTALASASLLLATMSMAQTAQQTALLVNATATNAPPTLQFTWPLDATATSYTVARRAAGATAWGAAATIPGGGAITAWSDTAITAGNRYEYWFTKNGGITARGFVTAGVEASAIESRGKLLLLVDDSQAPFLASRIDRLIRDLVGDGWTVVRHDVARDAAPTSVKALIAADVAAGGGQVRSVFLLGHVPVPYSGYLAPDGHPDHYGAWPADCYYGELNGPWTDSTLNSTAASRQANWNTPGDGKFDQSSLPSDVDLAVGRVDFADLPSFAASETVLLQRYLDKDHDYRHKVFAAEPRCVIDDNFGYFGGEAFAASGWRAGSALCGTANTIAGDYFTTLNTTTGPSYVWSYGCGGGWYQGAGGVGSTTDFANSQNRAVFTMLFGSYFGDWDSTDNFLRASLAQGWTLSAVWAGRPHWSFHPMGMGETLGTCTRLSQNDTGVGGYGTRFVHIALLGDPTLRQHVLAPPAGVQVVDLWPQANVTWNASSDPVAGYHIYRAATATGPFTRLTTAPIAGTAWLDPAPIQGDATYLVRAVRLETTPTGSYWNLSQGAYATTYLPQVAATHTSFGTGCYTIGDSLYANFVDATAADARLLGQALVLTPNGASYVASRTAAGWLAPTANATALPLGDDDATAVPLAQPFPLPGGSTTTLYVHSNGIVAGAPLAMSALQSKTPNTAALLAEASAAFYAWHDFDPTASGSGAVLVETSGSVLTITWNGVADAVAGASAPNTLQFRFDLGTGTVAIASNGLVGNAPYVFGWSPGGASVDAGPTDLQNGLPFAIPAANRLPLQLSASPAPISTPSSGALVTYTITEAPPTAPGSGQYVGIVVASVQGVPNGIALANLGLPDCRLYVGALDVPILAVGNGPTLTASLQLGAGLPPGAHLHATGIALFAPGSLPNGQNAFGAITSNGIDSRIGRF